MKIIIGIVVLAFLSFEVRGQDNRTDILRKIFGDIEEGVISKNPVVPNSNKPCECVKYYLCSPDNVIITNGNGNNLIDLKQQDECPKSDEVCCKLPDTIKPKPKDCGYRNSGSIGFRIRGDEDSEAQFGEFPWMVAVLADEFNAGADKTLEAYKCGGTLIHPQVVLTAAHCVSSSLMYKVRAGEWDSQNTNESIPHQDRFVESKVIHDKYFPGPYFNDIAILFLDSPLNITETVNTLCLPVQDFVVPGGTQCIATGWGRTVFGKKGTFQTILKKVELPIVERNTCEAKLRDTRLGRYFQLDKSFICAGGEPGKGTCTGDGGGPLACPIPGQKDRYQHIGITAWGIGCDENKVPGVYVNLPLFRT